MWLWSIIFTVQIVHDTDSGLWWQEWVCIYSSFILNHWTLCFWPPYCCLSLYSDIKLGCKHVHFILFVQIVHDDDLNKWALTGWTFNIPGGFDILRMIPDNCKQDKRGIHFNFCLFYINKINLDIFCIVSYKTFK